VGAQNDPSVLFLYEVDFAAEWENVVVGAVRLSWKGGPNQAVDLFLPEEYN